MIEVDYALTTSSRFLENIAEKLVSNAGVKTTIENNALVFPSGLAVGKFEHYPVDANLSLCLIDCTFLQEIRFNRLPASINYFHALTFNLSTISLMVERHDSKGLHAGESWHNKIMYSSSEKGLKWTAPENSNIRMVIIYFTRAWLQENYAVNNLPSDFPYASEFMEDRALQFSLDLDLDLLIMLQEILGSPAPKYMSNLYYEGCARKLIALVAQRLAKPVTGSELKYEDVTLLLHLEQRLEEKLDIPLPSLEDLARECYMSKSKFEKLFKAVFGKNVTDFFYNIKMTKAADLLKQGWEPNKVAHMVGFPTASHFIKVFKVFYKTTPKSFQISLTKK
jgi:AraC-like DNA-binding protein